VKISIVGTGQLARMLALEGWAMGMEFSFLDTLEASSTCVEGLGPVIRYQAGTQARELYQQLGSPDVITVEKEDVDTRLLTALQEYCFVYPDPSIIHICQHRGRERELLDSIGAPSVAHEKVSSVNELHAAIRRIGLPAILKSCESGYDGQNQWSLETQADVDTFTENVSEFTPSILESRVSFKRELSIILARGVDGRYSVYPLTENFHSKGVLLTSIAPAPNIDALLLSQMDDLVMRFISAWDYVGVLAIECFETDNGLLVNELAPRVHNSRHWTQFGADTNQFQNHLRAISGMTLGQTHARGCVGMVNILGRAGTSDIICHSNSQVHLYNKAPRPGRKLGHVNLLEQDRQRLEQKMNQMLLDIYGESEVKLLKNMQGFFRIPELQHDISQAY